MNSYDSAFGIDLELVFDNVGKHVGHFQACGAHLLWNETGSCHARSGVNLKHVDAVAAVRVLGDYVVYADNAIAVQDVIDAARLGLQGSCKLWADAGRSDFLDLTIVLSVVVEELIVSNHLGNREYHTFGLSLVATHGHLGAVEEAFHHYLVVLLEGILDGWCKFVLALYFCYTKARAVVGGFHETWHAKVALDVVLGDVALHVLYQQDAVGNGDAKGAHIVVEHIFVECQSLDKHAAGGVR